MGRDVELTVVNHDPVSIETLTSNHAGVNDYCMSLDALDPCRAVPGGHLDLLWASPECTNHSRAKGGRPRSDQSRASAWLVCKWLQELYVDSLIIENVPEFVEWGPLGKDGRPLQAHRGETFRAWLAAVRSLGYRLDWRILTCADFGDATTRKRFFLVARRDRRRLVWPARLFAARGAMLDGADLFEASSIEARTPWRPASEIIDWSLPCPSIFLTPEEARAWGREHGMPAPHRPLAEKTMARIAEGVRRFVIEAKNPFLVMPTHGCDRFRGQSIDVPLATQGGSNRFALVEPFVMPIDHRSCEAPGAPIGIPLSTMTTKARHALISPWIVKHFGGVTGNDARAPLSTITTRGTQLNLGVAFLAKYFGTGDNVISLGEPMPTQSTRDRFALTTVMIHGEPWQIVDIGMRMLQPHELAAAHSFPADYRFAGSKGAQVAQIGNSVPVRTSRALAGAQLEGVA